MAVTNDDTISSGTISTSTCDTSSWNVSLILDDYKTNYIIGDDFVDAIKKKINERSKDMMGLYEVYVVNKKLGKQANDVVVAKDDRIAERKVVLPGDWNLDDLVFFTRLIGEWKSEKPQKVKIVKE